MRFGLLGTLQVLDCSGTPVDVGGPQARAVLARLLVAEGEPVSADQLADAVWGEAPPASAHGVLQSYVSRLRKALEPDRGPRQRPTVLVSEGGRYRLAIADAEVEHRLFEVLADEGRALLESGQPALAKERLLAADSLWRGPALVEVADRDFARGLAQRLEERRLAALEDRIAADLALRRHGAVVGELTELVAMHPFRENLWAHLALALYCTGRQADALRALSDMRRALADELGVDPSPALRELEARILAHDPSLDVPERPDAPTAAGSSVAPPRSSGGRGLVGREAETAELVAALEDALAGSTRFVIIEGEAGIGKSRMLEELAGLATDRGAAVAWGRGHEMGLAPALGPWIAALKSLLGDSSWLSATAPDDWELDPLRVELFGEVHAAIRRQAASSPAVLLFDDLHWADGASVDVLRWLADQMWDDPVLVVGTLRPLDRGRNDGLVAALSSISRRPRSVRLHLRGLDIGATTALIEQMTTVDVPADVVSAIHQRAEGNPFYALELARYVASDPATTAAAIARAGVPTGVQDVIRRRLARLPYEALDLLQAAAVVGREFQLAMLGRVADLDVATYLEQLDHALVKRLVVPATGEPSTFRFAHSLIRDVVGEETPILRRAQLHLRSAEAIIEIADDDDHAELIASHLLAALPFADVEHVGDRLVRAAVVAAARYAYETADDLLASAVQLYGSTEHGRIPEEVELSAIVRLVAIRRIRQSYTSAATLSALQRGKHLAERTGRLDVLIELLWTEWAGVSSGCDLDRAAEIAADVSAIAERTGDPMVTAVAHHVWGAHCWSTGRITEACHHLGLSTAIDQPELPATLREIRALSENFNLVVREMAGLLDDPERAFADLAASRSDLYSRLTVHWFGAYAALVTGDYQRALRAVETHFDLDAVPRFAFAELGARMFHAVAQIQLGRHEEGLRTLDRSLPAYLEIGPRANTSLYLAHRGLALERLRQSAEAAEALEEAFAELATYGERGTEPWLWLVAADMARTNPLVGEEPGPLLVRAYDLATTQGAHAVAAHIAATANRWGLGWPAGDRRTDR